MAEMQNFRTALGGFHREDVVRYIEYLNKNHTNLVNQLRSENQSLQKELDSAREALADTRKALADKENDGSLQELTAENQALREELAQRKLELAQAKENAAQELESYRRAERMERSARERSELIYRQAVSALGEATSLVDGCAGEFDQIAQRVVADIAQLRSSVELSRDTLQTAVSTMYAIRPTEEQKETETPPCGGSDKR